MQKIRGRKWLYCRKEGEENGCTVEKKRQKIFVVWKRKDRKWLYCRKEEVENICSVEKKRQKMVILQKRRGRKQLYCGKLRAENGCIAEKDGAKNIFNAEKKEQKMVVLWKIGGRKWLFCGKEEKEHGYQSCHGCNSYRKLNSNICCCYILGSQQLGSQLEVRNHQRDKAVMQIWIMLNLTHCTGSGSEPTTILSINLSFYSIINTTSCRKSCDST